jgi:hypothetical protein
MTTEQKTALENLYKAGFPGPYDEYDRDILLQAKHLQETLGVGVPAGLAYHFSPGFGCPAILVRDDVFDWLVGSSNGAIFRNRFEQNLGLKPPPNPPSIHWVGRLRGVALSRGWSKERFDQELVNELYIFLMVLDIGNINLYKNHSRPLSP